MKFGTIYLIIETKPSVYSIGHLTKVFFWKKMLGGTLAPMALLLQIPLLIEKNVKKKHNHSRTK